MSVKISPELSGFVDQVNQAITQAKEAGLVATPQMARASLQALSSFITNVPNVSFVEDLVLTAPTHSIPVRIYSPDPDRKLPVVLYFHGGGHMCGDIELYDPICRKIAMAGQCVVVSVEYRLAPEFPYPCGLDDAEFAVKNYLTVLTDVGFNNEIYIAGDSGGGAICASLTARQVSDPALKFTKQILIYPSLDYTLSCDSIDELATGYFLEKHRIEWYFDHYFQNGESRREVSPLFNPINKNSPNTLVLTAECDPLKDEAKAYVNKLRDANVGVEYFEFKGMTHAFMNLENLVPDSTQLLYEKIGQFINSPRR